MKLMIFALLLVYGCASTMPGKDINTGTDKVSATIEKDGTFSDDNIQMYQFSFKNNTNEWVELEGGVLEAGENVSVLVGDKISSWIEACNIEKKVSDYNTNLLLGSLAIGGAAVAGASGHQRTAQVGAIVSLGAISGIAVREYQKDKKKAEFQKAFPEKHIFHPVIIPPGKVVQRWILVENRQQETFGIKLGKEVKLKVLGRIESDLPKPGPYQRNYQLQ